MAAICDKCLLPASTQSLPQAAPVSSIGNRSYGQILTSSAMIGGSSALNIAIGVVRTKAMALLLGPAGFGLAGIYGSVADLAQAIAGMGINSSGVRQIAEAVGSNDSERIARTTVVLRRTSVVLGVLGTVLVLVFSRQISSLTFGTARYSGALCLLSLVVLLRLISAGQGALIQGMRRIADLAKMGVLGALLGTIISIPMVYWFRQKGIVPSLVATAAVAAITSWWYSRRVHVQAPSITVSQVGKEAGALLKLGLAFMASGLMTMGVGYGVRLILLRKIGFEATGLFQSAWTIGGLYVGFILQAMAADFYPRLTASANDNASCNRLVNEQALVGLLLAGPGVLATLTLAPLVIALLYTAKFDAAVGLLRWVCLGTTLQVISWPMGFIILAKGRQNLFFWSEFAWMIVHIALAWVSIRWFGLNGAGIAFFGSYVFHVCLIYPIVHILSGFRWSRENRNRGLLFLSIIAAVFCSFYVLPRIVAMWAGVVAVCLSSYYSIRVLLTLVSVDVIPLPIRRFIVTFGLVPTGPATHS